MAYTKERPMSVDCFKDKTIYKQDARFIMLWVGIGIVGFMTAWSITALIVPVPDLWRTWLLALGALGVIGIASYLLTKAQQRVHHEWHLYRGDIEAVGEIVTEKQPDGSTISWYPVRFAGDQADTRFTPEDFAARADSLQPCKHNVLVVRRTIVVDLPTYEGTFLRA